MKRTAMLSLAIGFAACAAAGPPADNSAIIGVWKGKMEGLPAVTLTIEEEDGKLTGAVLFTLFYATRSARLAPHPAFRSP